MKLTNKRNRGGILLGLLVLVLAVVIIGLVAYAIIKALSNWRPRTINPDDVAQWVQSAVIEIESNPEANVLSDGTMVQPLGSTNDLPFIIVETTTNLIDWYVRTNIPASEFDRFIEAEPVDKNLPATFYRTRTR